jgi:protoporphyrinogen oxidase
MRPYNRKLWGADLRRLDAKWVTERIAAPTGTPDNNAAGSGRRLPLPKEATVAYPARGGYGEIFRALARNVADLRLSRLVSGIDPRSSTLRTENDETMSWRRIISTLPLPALLRLLPDVPPSITSAVSALEALPITLVMLALDGRHETLRQRDYCPDESIPGHKIVLNHNSSRWLRALPRHGIQVELSELGPIANGADAETLVNAALAGLVRMGVIASTGSVRRTSVFRIPLGYPVPTQSRVNIVARAQNWLSELRIYNYRPLWRMGLHQFR